MRATARILGSVSLVAIVSALSVTAASSQDIILTDMADREVLLSAPAERIVAIPVPQAAIITFLDQGVDRLVGMNQSAKDALLEGILGVIFPEAADIPSQITGSGFMPNIEEVARLDPDLVIQWGDRGNDIVDPLTNAGLTTLLIRYGTEEYAREYITLVAAAIGRPERAEEHIAWRQEVEAAINEGVAGIADEDRPRVVLLEDVLTNLGIRAADTFQSEAIVLAGGVNVADELSGTPTVSREQVAEWNPEIILLNGFEEELTPEHIYNDPILSLTDAAQAGRVYKFPLGGYRWDPPSHESPLAWMWLADLLHPEIFSFDLRAETRAAFETMYDYTLSDAELDAILRLDIHENAVEYEQFAAQ